MTTCKENVVVLHVYKFQLNWPLKNLYRPKKTESGKNIYKRNLIWTYISFIMFMSIWRTYQVKNLKKTHRVYSFKWMNALYKLFFGICTHSSNIHNVKRQSFQPSQMDKKRYAVFALCSLSRDWSSTLPVKWSYSHAAILQAPFLIMKNW